MKTYVKKFYKSYYIVTPDDKMVNFTDKEKFEYIFEFAYGNIFRMALYLYSNTRRNLNEETVVDELISLSKSCFSKTIKFKTCKLPVCTSKLNAEKFKKILDTNILLKQMDN